MSQHHTREAHKKDQGPRRGAGPAKHMGFDRHSGMVGRGLPKKGGFAGWGRPGEEDGVDVLDTRDPNYDDLGEEFEEEPLGEHRTVENPAKVTVDKLPPTENITPTEATGSAPSQPEAH